jgi:hypothetical protein
LSVYPRRSSRGLMRAFERRENLGNLRRRRSAPGFHEHARRSLSKFVVVRREIWGQVPLIDDAHYRVCGVAAAMHRVSDAGHLFLVRPTLGTSPFSRTCGAAPQRARDGLGTLANVHGQACLPLTSSMTMRCWCSSSQLGRHVDPKRIAEAAAARSRTPWRNTGVTRTGLTCQAQASLLDLGVAHGPCGPR